MGKRASRFCAARGEVEIILEVWRRREQSGLKLIYEAAFSRHSTAWLEPV
jgi:hypothetical protein